MLHIVALSSEHFYFGGSSLKTKSVKLLIIIIFVASYSVYRGKYMAVTQRIFYIGIFAMYTQSPESLKETLINNNILNKMKKQQIESKKGQAMC